jgi:hypothetical protein
MVGSAWPELLSQRRGFIPAPLGRQPIIGYRRRTCSSASREAHVQRGQPGTCVQRLCIMHMLKPSGMRHDEHVCLSAAGMCG